MTLHANNPPPPLSLSRGPDFPEDTWPYKGLYTLVSWAYATYCNSTYDLTYEYNFFAKNVCDYIGMMQ